MAILLGNVSRDTAVAATNANPSQSKIMRWEAVAGGVPTLAKIHSNDADTTNMRVGVYATDGTNGNPGTLLYQSDPALAVDGIMELPLVAVGTPPEIVAGTLYYIGVIADDYFSHFLTNAPGGVSTPWQAGTGETGTTFSNPFAKGTGGSTDYPIAMQIESATHPKLTETFYVDAEETTLYTGTVDCSVHDATTRALVTGPTSISVSNGAFTLEDANLAHSTKYLVVPISDDGLKGRPFYSTTDPA